MPSNFISKTDNINTKHLEIELKKEKKKEKDIEIVNWNVSETKIGEQQKDYSARDIKMDGYYMLFTKNSDRVHFYPVTKKAVFKQIYREDGEVDVHITNTFALIKRRKVKPSNGKAKKDKSDDSLDEMINKDPDFQDKDELSFDDGDSAYDQFIKEKKVQEEEKKNENMQDKELDKMLQRRAFDNVKEEDFSDMSEEEDEGSVSVLGD